MISQKHFFEVTKYQEGVLITKKSAPSRNHTEPAAFPFDYRKQMKF